ncbi:MAG: bifunctional phosphoribosylaminoimidazolecarboxamide formyltransferase/IMP cyclohydrolase [Thermoplasmata archaeon]
MSKIKRALISVSDKTGLAEFSKELSALGVEILSTGGTAKMLRDQGINVKNVSEVTGFPEILDGRVKTLHPMIHGGLLARRDIPEHMEAIRNLKITPIDMVVVNLYPFEKTIMKPDVPMEEVIENIDIGGPSMLRSAAKNHASVAVVVDPADYPAVIDEMKAHDGELTPETMRRLAVKAFSQTAKYDSIISTYLGMKFTGELFPADMTLGFTKLQDLRYGENPHQKAAFYKLASEKDRLSIADAQQLQGKELSYCNIIDLDAAMSIVVDFEKPTATIIKHTNPCGTASAESISRAFRIAYDADPISAFGCVVGLNRTLDLATAQEMSKHFIEAVIAPDYDQDALEVLKEKKNLRLLRMGKPLQRAPEDANRRLYTNVRGGLLVQTEPYIEIRRDQLKVVTKRKPTEEEIDAMMFGVKVARYIKSNTILLVKGERTVGVGAGQMSRVDSATIAGMKAGPEAKGSVLVSDAFFPFRDGVDAAAKVGVAAIIQPGGSVRDQEVIQAADEHGIAMVFSGVRLFKH